MRDLHAVLTEPVGIPSGCGWAPKGGQRDPKGSPGDTIGAPGAPKVTQKVTDGRMYLTFRNVRFSLIVKCQVHPPLGDFLCRFYCPLGPNCVPGALFWVPFWGPGAPKAARNCTEGRVPRAPIVPPGLRRVPFCVLVTRKKESDVHTRMYIYNLGAEDDMSLEQTCSNHIYIYIYRTGQKMT